MSLPRLDHATHIADQLNNLAAVVKTRSRASLTDANRILETISAQFFNALFGWELVNLNTDNVNYPAADLGDRGRRIAIQVTNEGGSDKIKRTADKAVAHELNIDFDRLVVFFLLPRKPGLPKNFTQPTGGPMIETWDIADLLKQLQDLPDLKALARAVKVLDEEMGRAQLPEGVEILRPRLRIQRGIQIELLHNNPPELTLLTWDLPPMSSRFGARSAQYCPTWKKIHTHSERVYYAFRLAHISMVLCHERQDRNGGETVTPFVENAVSKFRAFTNEIQSYPKNVSKAEHLVALQNAERGFSALFWLLANSKPGTDEFMQAVQFVERLCSWCFETLSRADRVLENYFETRKGIV